MNVLRLTFTFLLFLSVQSFAAETSVETIDTGDGEVDYWVFEK